MTRVTARAPSPDADRGADGPAALARDSEIVTIGGAARGSIQVERIEVRRVFNTTLARLCRDGHITDAELVAGNRFAGLWRASAGQPRVTARLDGGAPGRSVADGADRAVEARAALDEIRPLLTVTQWTTIVSVCGLDEPSARRLRFLKPALGMMAKQWGYR